MIGRVRRWLRSAAVFGVAPIIGMNPGSQVMSLPNAQQHLAAMRALGVVELRTEIPWQSVEGTPGVFDWSSADRSIGAVVAAGLRPYVLLDYSTTWGSSHPPNMFSAPADPARFAAFAGAFAQRYGSVVDSYEIWNEPNTALFWRPQDGSARAYGRLFELSREAIVAADPPARVVFGAVLSGTGSSWTAWRDWMSRAASTPNLRFDAVSIHPYGGDVTDDVAWLRQQYRGVSINISEYGDAAADQFSIEPGVKRRFQRETSAIIAAGVRVFMPYVWYSTDGWSMTYPDATLTPYGRAFFESLARAARHRP